MSFNICNIGVDIGSTTVKVVVLDGDMNILFSRYERHHSRVREKTLEILAQTAPLFKTAQAKVALSGSAGLSVSQITGLPFVQEVFATKIAVDKLLPDIDVVVELGGEDAKILFMTGGTEERMNGSCAGGTGAFIDQMASLLSLSLPELDTLYDKHEQTYNIASRCGVFAKSDIQPLLNQGANKADIAASIYQAIVDQTIAGLAQGREMKGKIAFLGGPLTFLHGLRDRFVKTLKLDEQSAVFPPNAEFYVSIGAAIGNLNKTVFSYEQMINKVNIAGKAKNSNEALPPLFATKEEYAEFCERHSKSNVKKTDIFTYSGDAYLGIDAGSTTTKLVLITEDARILHSYYASNFGDPLTVLQKELITLYDLCGERITVRSCAVTGYGEDLIKNAFKIDFGIVETIAHYYAAKHFNPNVDFILDIGGQDMKCFRLKSGVVDSILINEACSSGCGSFIETFASTLGYSVAAFAKLGVEAQHPVNLGSRCTVFMNSSVKQAQKDGAGVDDISAGLSISVIKNVVYKVIRAKRADGIGENIVVQGGTFLNDAVLRAFELEIGKNVTRPVISGLMGAFGTALYAKCLPNEHSTLITKERLAEFTHKASISECKLCTNNCKLTINYFSKNDRYISGNRCERPLGKHDIESLPNAYQFKLEQIEKLESVTGKRGRIGIPLGLNLYENLIFWHKLFTELGFDVIHSGVSSRKLYSKGQHTIPSDTVCYPAKLMHGHIEELLEKGIKTIFYPCMPYNFDEKTGDNHFNCPIVAYYPELLSANITELKKVKYLNPYLMPSNRRTFPSKMADFLNTNFDVPVKETGQAVKKAYRAYAEYQEKLLTFGSEAIDSAEKAGKETIVLAGRPYHIDPEVNHGIAKLLTSLGMVVISEDCLCRPEEKQKVNVLNQWMYHSRLYYAAKYVTEHSHINLVQLVSFGCGLDAITTDEVKDILESKGKIYTQIKIDEINNLGAAKIRLRSLEEAIKSQNKGISSF